VANRQTDAGSATVTGILQAVGHAPPRNRAPVGRRAA